MPLSLFGTRTPRHTADTGARSSSDEDRQPPELAELGKSIELLTKREGYVDHLIEKEIEGARQHAAVDRKREAMECLKRKKIHEKERDQLAANKFKLIEQEATLRALRFSSVVASASTAGTAAIEREVKKLGGIEGVERQRDRLEDALDDANDVLRASSEPIGDAAKLDDEALWDELMAMELMDTTEKLSQTNIAQPVPVPLRVPQSVPAPSQAARDREVRDERELAELAQLQASMTLERPTPMAMMAAC